MSWIIRHGFVPVPPLFQPGVDVVLVGVDEGVPGDRGPDDRLDRPLLDIGHDTQPPLPAAPDQAEDRRLVLRQRAAARRSRHPATPSRSPLLTTAFGWPLCPATTEPSSISPSPPGVPAGSLAARPRRSFSVMSCTSGWLRPSSRAICRLERFRPMK